LPTVSPIKKPLRAFAVSPTKRLNVLIGAREFETSDHLHPMLLRHFSWLITPQQSSQSCGDPKHARHELEYVLAAQFQDSFVLDLRWTYGTWLAIRASPKVP
jgi:hypothetical protein